MIRRHKLSTRNVKLLILDEADEMLSKGFKEQIYDIYRYLPPATQVVLVSATLPQEVLQEFYYFSSFASSPTTPDLPCSSIASNWRLHRFSR